MKYIHRPTEIIWPPLPPWSLVSLVSRDIIRSTNSAGLMLPEHAGYIGLLPFVAVPFALLHRSRRIMVFFALWSAAAISVDRIAQLGNAYGANFELMYGLRSVGGYEIPLERTKTFLADLSRIVSAFHSNH